MTIHVDLSERGYDIELSRGAIKKAGELLPLCRKVLVVTDDGVPTEYADTVASFAEYAFKAVIPQGEASKSMKYFEMLLLLMLENGFTRHDAVVAVGGGVVGDLAGFAASCYMRGIDFYNIPTTLLSQVDSSIGGKTAVDFHGVKNIVGTFYQPKKVIIDPDVLKTLPKRQIAAGFAESVKMALTFDEDFFSFLEKEDAFENIDKVIEKSLLIKKYVVERDEKESSLRKVLNFGHTIGHGIESEKSPSLYHGECVALGMLPMCSDEIRARLINVLSRAGLPVSCDVDMDRVMEAVAHDKKSSSDGIDCVTVEKAGSYVIEKLSVPEIRARAEKIFSSEGKR